MEAPLTEPIVDQQSSIDFTNGSTEQKSKGWKDMIVYAVVAACIVIIIYYAGSKFKENSSKSCKSDKKEKTETREEMTLPNYDLAGAVDNLKGLQNEILQRVSDIA